MCASLEQDPFCGFLCTGYAYRVDVVDIVVDIVDVDIDVDLVDVDVDRVDLVDVDVDRVDVDLDACGTPSPPKNRQRSALLPTKAC